jgi:hypothetical protein
VATFSALEVLTSTPHNNNNNFHKHHLLCDSIRSVKALRKEKEALAKAKANTDARERRASSSSKKEANLKKREEEMRAKGDIVKTKSAGALI